MTDAPHATVKVSVPPDGASAKFLPAPHRLSDDDDGDGASEPPPHALKATTVATAIPLPTPPIPANDSLGAERFLHAIEKALLLDGIAAGTRVLFERFALALIQFGRNDDMNGDVMIAALRSAHRRHAVTAKS